MEKLVALRDLRENTEEYIKKIQKGLSFVILRKSKPIFKIVPLEKEDGDWEPIIDFTKIKKGGIAIKDILSRI
ncbi:MAG: hypothetical protein WC705_00115 [Candidatus Paceibacterota bacterium]|jgi:antitoxin (DNA-binding transcriptional repressor) of toxin-antitoxin stability system